MDVGGLLGMMQVVVLPQCPQISQYRGPDPALSLEMHQASENLVQQST